MAAIGRDRFCAKPIKPPAKTTPPSGDDTAYDGASAGLATIVDDSGMLEEDFGIDGSGISDGPTPKVISKRELKRRRKYEVEKEAKRLKLRREADCDAASHKEAVNAPAIAECSITLGHGAEARHAALMEAGIAAVYESAVSVPSWPS